MMKKEDQQERLAEFFCILEDLRCVLANRKTTIMEREAVLKEIENNWLSRFHWGAASGVYWLVGGLISRRQSDTAEKKMIACGFMNRPVCSVRLGDALTGWKVDIKEAQVAVT